MKALLLVMASFAFAVPVLAQDRIVVDIKGDDTCSTTKGEPGFDANNWQISGTNTVPLTPGGGKGVSAPKLQDLLINRSLDACSEKLIRAFLSGTVIPTVTLTEYRTGSGASGGTGFPAVTVTLTLAALVNYSISGATGVHPTENLDFEYAKMCVATVAQNTDGTLKPAVQVCYDSLKNIVSSN